MVGAVRFELTTSCTRNKRATRLRYAPTLSRKQWRVRRQFAIEFSLIFCTGSATAGDRLGGVRPSSGAAMSERERAPNGIGRIGTTAARCARGRAHSDNVVV